MRRRNFLRAAGAGALLSRLQRGGFAADALRDRASASTHTGDLSQEWTHFVRIGAYRLKADNAEEIVRDAQASGVFGIEVDNDITGRYESFVDPEPKLRAIRAVAEKAHAVGNYAFVYIAGTECITAKADATPHTLAKEHPDWLQKKITGEPAIFGGGTAFWIAKGDEDVWISPYAVEWRKTYMERVRQIAATGIDGVYVDIPYWMTHFDGWEDTWASFDEHTVAAFRQRTGLDAKKDLKLGNFSDPNFRKWVDFRIQTITDFMHEIDIVAKSVNSKIKTIPEIYPGIESEAVRVGADVYSLYPVVDAIAHEYEFGGGDHMASSRTTVDWFNYQVGMHAFRAFGEGKPTWILNYSWDGDKKVDAREAMMNLAMSQVMAGANFWDAPGHSMAGSNHLPTRKKIFEWIKENQQTLYSPRIPVDPVGVYFSPATRDVYADEFIAAFRRLMVQLMQSHREFQVVTPRALGKFLGQTLSLPDVRILSSQEKIEFRRHLDLGARIIIIGDDQSGLPEHASVIRRSASAAPADKTQIAEVDPTLLADIRGGDFARVDAGSPVATSIARVNGQLHIFFANFAGLVGGSNPVQTPQSGVKVTVSTPSHKGYFLPFLGRPVPITGAEADSVTTFMLPVIEKGAVFWCEA